MPSETLTGGLRFDVVRAIVDGEFQGVNAGTSRISGVVVLVCTRCGVGCAVPRVALTRSFCLDIMCAVVDGEFQSVNARTAEIIGVVVLVSA